MVDAEAKAAAQGESSELPDTLSPLLCLPTSQAALRAAYKKRTASQWKDSWSSSRAGQRHYGFDKTPPGRQPLKWYADLPRRQCSIITQLRTGHIGLNAYLARFGAVDSPLCQTCREPETVNHFLFTCRRFCEQRNKLRHALYEDNRQGLDKRTLLGKVKNRPLLLDFVRTSGRFPQYDTHTCS
jgi:hypothetical protein